MPRFLYPSKWTLCLLFVVTQLVFFVFFPFYPLTLQASPFRLAVVSSYPPEKCGIAEFTSDLLRQHSSYFSSSSQARVRIIALDSSLVDGKPKTYDLKVVDHIIQGKLLSHAKSLQNYKAAATFINENYDAVSIHHEFSLFGGGHAGQLVLDFLSFLKLPIHLVLHFVPNVEKDRRYEMLNDMLRYVNHVSVFLPEHCNHTCKMGRIFLIYFVLISLPLILFRSNPFCSRFLRMDSTWNIARYRYREEPSVHSASKKIA